MNFNQSIKSCFICIFSFHPHGTPINRWRTDRHIMQQGLLHRLVQKKDGVNAWVFEKRLAQDKTLIDAIDN